MTASDFLGNLQIFRKVFLLSRFLELSVTFPDFFFGKCVSMVCSIDVLLINVLCFI